MKILDALKSGIKWGLAFYFAIMLYSIHVQLQILTTYARVQAEVLMTFYAEAQQAKKDRRF